MYIFDTSFCTLRAISYTTSTWLFLEACLQKIGNTRYRGTTCKPNIMVWLTIYSHVQTQINDGHHYGSCGRACNTPLSGLAAQQQACSAGKTLCWCPRVLMSQRIFHHGSCVHHSYSGSVDTTQTDHCSPGESPAGYA